MREVLLHHLEQFKRSTILKTLQMTPQGYILVSAHREENVDEPERLRSLLEALGELAVEYAIPVLMSTHPRTRQRLDELQEASFPGLQLHKPFGFSDYIRLQKSARCVLSDSGTISEESSILEFPAVTLRPLIERPEALDAGAIMTVGVSPESILDGVRMVFEQHSEGNSRKVPAEYMVSDFSTRVVNFIRSTASSYHGVRGIRKRSSMWAVR